MTIETELSSALKSVRVLPRPLDEVHRDVRRRCTRRTRLRTGIVTSALTLSLAAAVGVIAGGQLSQRHQPAASAGGDCAVAAPALPGPGQPNVSGEATDLSDEAIVQHYLDGIPSGGFMIDVYGNPGIIYAGVASDSCTHLNAIRALVAHPSNIRVFLMPRSETYLTGLVLAATEMRNTLAQNGIYVCATAIDPGLGQVTLNLSNAPPGAQQVLRKLLSPTDPDAVVIGDVCANPA